MSDESEESRMGVLSPEKEKPMTSPKLVKGVSYTTSENIPLIKYGPYKSIIDKLENQYSRVLDAAGLNAADPVTANIGYFNILQKVFVDPAKIGKTYIFFTRPNLNFRNAKNIVRNRVFSYFFTQPLGRTLMRMLMHGPTATYMTYGMYPDEDNFNQKVFGTPEALLHVGTAVDTIVGGEEDSDSHPLFLPMIDSNFITLLSNTCLESSNGKDIILGLEETNGNFNGNRLQYGSGIDDSQSIGEITLSFKDIAYSPVFNLFYLWVMYIHYVNKGLCVPEYNYLVNRIIDYTCSIYIFMTATDGQTILRWNRLTSAFPRIIPFGQIQHTQDTDNEALRDLSISFAYNSASPMDPLILTEFNMLAGASLWGRFAKNKQYAPTQYMNHHHMSFRQAMEILVKYGPRSDDLPSPALLGYKDDAGNVPLMILQNFYKGYSDQDHSTYFEGVEIDPKDIEVLKDYDAGDFSAAPASLLNRYYGMIRNAWCGLPYIVDGNKLMFL